MFTSKDEYDVIIVGGGHAGIEAAFAAARLGNRTCIFSISLDAVANVCFHTFFPRKAGLGAVLLISS